MRAGTLVLYTDQPARRAELLHLLGQIAPCQVLDAAAMPPAGPCAALVADLANNPPAPGSARGPA